MNFVEFQDLLALPFVVCKKGSKFQDLLALPFVGIQEGKVGVKGTLSPFV